MRRLIKSGAGSAVVHAAVVGGFLLLDLTSGDQPLIIDLTIRAAETMESDAEPLKAAGPPAPAPTQAVASRPQARPRARRPEKVVPSMPSLAPKSVDSIAEDPTSPHEAPSPAASGDNQPSQAAPGGGSASPSTGPANEGRNAGPAAATSGASSGNGVGAQQAYLARHFAYIREAIQRSAAYPPLARRMGWVGRVVVSFRIQADGTVVNVRVTKGAGFPVLDTGAIEAVRRAAPFPRPPAEADIVVPVAYALE